jgi:putative endonuclease
VTRQEAEQRGRGAETIACWYLRMHGWRILARRARVPGGEVDIVARRGRTLAFVEVKARGDVDSAALALDEWRLRRVAVAAALHGRRRRSPYRRHFHPPVPLAAAPDQRLAGVTKA